MRRILFDFSDPTSAPRWRPIDDRVMGGVSSSRLRPDPAGHAVFEGDVSLDRHGGFASVRSAAGDCGSPGAGRCLLEVRGDAKRFKLKLLTDDSFDGIHYQAAFMPSPAEWRVIDIPLAAFRPTFRGRDVPHAPPLDAGRIRQVGLMIADRQAGPFALAIRHISVA